MSENPVPKPDDVEPCRGCQELDLREATAYAERDKSRQADCRVLRERHQRDDHGGQP